MSVCQKRTPDLITDGYEPPCGCWELNSGPLEEQSVLLTTEPSLQPLCITFYLIYVHGYFACMYTCRPEEGTRSHYRWL